MWNNVIYVENTYLLSHSLLLFIRLHTPWNCIHIYACIIIYGLQYALIFFPVHDFILLLNCTHFSLSWIFYCVHWKFTFFCQRSMISARDCVEWKKLRIHISFRTTDFICNLRKGTWKKGEKEKNRLGKEIKLFLNKNGKFTSFLTSGLKSKFSSRKTHLLFAIAFCVSI